MAQRNFNSMQFIYFLKCHTVLGYAQVTLIVYPLIHGYNFIYTVFIFSTNILHVVVGVAINQRASLLFLTLII